VEPVQLGGYRGELGVVAGPGAVRCGKLQAGQGGLAPGDRGAPAGLGGRGHAGQWELTGDGLEVAGSGKARVHAGDCSGAGSPAQLPAPPASLPAPLSAVPGGGTAAVRSTSISSFTAGGS